MTRQATSMPARPRRSGDHVDLDVSIEDPSRRSGPAPVEMKHRGLGEHADWYRDLLENTHDLICLHDLQGGGWR